MNNVSHVVSKVDYKVDYKYNKYHLLYYNMQNILHTHMQVYFLNSLSKNKQLLYKTLPYIIFSNICWSFKSATSVFIYFFILVMVHPFYKSCH